MRGFTLIELLTVVAIISLLAAIVLPNLQSARNKAQNARATVEMNSMKAAFSEAKARNGSSLAFLEADGGACDGDEDLDCMAGCSSDNSTEGCSTEWEAILSAITTASNINVNAFTEDPWGRPYILSVDGSAGSISSSGNDFEVGPGDPNTITIP